MTVRLGGGAGARLSRQLTRPAGAVTYELRRRGNRVLNASKRLCPVDEGRLRSSITLVIVTDARGPYAKIGSNLPYAIYVHEGTGIHAGRGYIYPKRGRFMRFESVNNSGSGRRRTGRYVYAKRTAGVKGRPFLRDGLRQGL